MPSPNIVYICLYLRGSVLDLGSLEVEPGDGCRWLAAVGVAVEGGGGVCGERPSVGGEDRHLQRGHCKHGGHVTQGADM